MHPVFELAPDRDDQEPVETAVARRPGVPGVAGRGRRAVEARSTVRDTVRLRGRGLQLRVTEAAGVLTPFSGGYLFVDPVDGAFVLTSYETGRRYRVTDASSGSLAIIGAEALGRADRADPARRVDGSDWEARSSRPTAGTAQPCRVGPSTNCVDGAEPTSRTTSTRSRPAHRRTPAAALAAYTLWSATVAPEGMITRESVLMSKHWMDKVWSWDHCFNALALAPGLPDLASTSSSSRSTIRTRPARSPTPSPTPRFSTTT